MTSINASTPLSISRRPASLIFALLAILTVGLLLLLPGGPVQAQDAGAMSYAENGTDPVYTFSAGDPEGVDTIVWTLLESHESDGAAIKVDDTDLTEDDVADEGDFSISADGVLTFKSPPNFEAPRDADADNDGTPDNGETSDNTYNVVVQASDGGTSNNAAAAMEYLTWFKVTVKVTDLEEKGSVSLRIDADPNGDDDFVSLVEPQVGIEINAALSDPDGPIPIPDANVTWRWYRLSDLAEEGEVILNADNTAELNSATHTPRDRAGANDVDMYLRVKATYEDRRGRRKTAEAVSLYPVLSAIVNENTLPKFAATTAERRVNENAAQGTAVGRPVTANDPDDEKLSYSLVPATDGDNAGDLNSFKIDPETGQITVDGSLDFEAQQEYTFQVRATDSRAESTGEADNGHAMVTVKVTDLDEMPQIMPDPETGVDADAMINTMLIEHEGGNAIEHLETDDASPVAIYLITDDDEGTPVLSVAGADADMFTFKYNVATVDVANDSMLAFKSKPDFENPADSGSDNIYEVTLQADDGNSSPGMLYVTVKVTNEEEPGKVTLSHQQPLIGQELMAMVTDSDGGFDPNGALTRVSWQWHVSDTDGGACRAVDDDAWNEKVGNADIYEPTGADDGRCLRATATYLDRTYGYPHAPVVTPLDDPGDRGMGFEASAQVVSGVVREDPANSKPEFPGTAVRFIPENTTGHKYVGDPVTADDGDSADVLTYSLDGADKNSFYIAGSAVTANDSATDHDDRAMAGQIRVGVRTKLDHEDESKYDVEVETTDSTSNNADAFDTTDVDIYVTDVDEKPDIWVNENGTRVMPNEGEFNVNYDEEDTAPVLTLMASDPEGVRSIVWSLLTDAEGEQNLGIFTDTDDNDVDDTTDDVLQPDVADHGSFKISGSGVLSFRSPPSFEGESEGADDVYRVVVQASDGGTTDDTNTPPDGYLNWFKVTVTVMDVEEDGRISLTPMAASNGDVVLLQPQVNIPINASLTDPDGGVTGTTWKWERRASRSSQWETIAGAEAAEYNPQDRADTDSTLAEENRVDVGDSLRVTATYDDANGSGKTAQKVLANPVLGALDDNTPPAFSASTATRRVDENAPKGTAVGAPVTAVDPDREGTGGTPNRKVTYWLAVDTNNNNLFTIDAETGQIRVETAQDYESPAGEGQGDMTKYVVVAMATDSSAIASEAVTVTIDLIDLDDAPEITLTETATPPTPTAPVRIQHVGGFAIERAEGAGAGLAVSSFSVDDDDGGTPTLSLSGTDENQFRIGAFAEAPTTAEASGTLLFKAAPDFENPADRNNDNIYEVTIVAEDGRNTTELDLTVKVTNAEESGTATLEYQQPLIGRALTASVMDPDGGFNPARGTERAEVTAVTWQWQVTNDKDFFDDDECPAATDDAWNAVVSGRAAMYQPKGSDNGGCLRASAMYMDRTYDYPQAPSDTPAAGDGFDEMVQVVSGVVRVDPANRAPVLGDAVRYAPEGTPGHKYVGTPVTATDSDDVVYSLGGDDGTAFYIAETDIIDVTDTTTRNEVADAGQIRVGARTRLDHEEEPEYSVEVTATDTYNDTATGEVTINVVDVDEAPVISVGGLNVSGRNSMDYAEKGTGAVATYTASGPDAAGARWSLLGDDAGDFNISSGGELTFRSSPNYESPADADTDNVYMVTVQANDGSLTADRSVTVTVTNVDEDGAVTLSPATPRVGAAITAVLTDPDNVVGSVNWQWASSADGSTGWAPIAGVSSGSYTPVTADVGNYLRAMPSYTDGQGPGKSAPAAVSANPVVAASSAPTTGSVIGDTYDTNDDGVIDLEEVEQALYDHFFGEGDEAINQEEVEDVLYLHFFPS